MKLARRLTALIARHKAETVVTAAFLVAAVVIGAVGTSAGTASRQPGQAPSFSLTALGQPGQRVSLSQYRGEPVIVNFWASWCAPCQRETQVIASFYRAGHGKVLVVGVDENDSATHALAFARAKGVTYPLAFDPRVSAATAYAVSGIPQTFFLDARHQIVDRVFGAVTMADLARGVTLMNRAPG